MLDDERLNNIDESDEQYEPINKPRQIILRLIALCILIAFLAFSIPNLPILLSNELDFIKPSQKLEDDAVVLETKSAVTSIEAVKTDKISTYKSRGTGFNIRPSGIVLTNQHVLADAEQVKVSFDDGSTFYSRSFNQIGTTDLAVIRIQGEELPIIQIDIDEIPEPGEIVTIIGNPLGIERIAQRGAVGSYYMDRDDGSLLFDIDVTAKKGNSGSPVLNQQGKAVGIIFAVTEIEQNNTKETRALAIPLQTVEADLEKVIN